MHSSRKHTLNFDWHFAPYFQFERLIMIVPGFFLFFPFCLIFQIISAIGVCPINTVFKNNNNNS